MSSIPPTDTKRKIDLDTAQHYHGLGFNLVPTGDDKRPVMVEGGRYSWDVWQTTRQTAQDLARIPWRGAAGLAAICGPVSGNLVCLDFDGVTDDTPVREALDALGVGTDYPWAVKTLRGGYHVWLRCHDLATGKGKIDRAGVAGCEHVELRYTGHYCILPPSNEGAYRFVQGHTPNTPPAIVTSALLLTAYDLVTVKKTTSTAPAVAPMTGATGNGYAQVALRNELGILAMATLHDRNNQLNRSAFSLGQLVGAGYLDRTEAESRLRAVALAIGLGEAETKGTIKSGIEDGIKEPRIIPQRNGAHGAPDFAPPPLDYLDDGAPAEPDDQVVEAPTAITTAPAWLLTEGADDDGNAACVYHDHGARYLYCDAYGWLAWNGRYWQREHAEALLDGAIVETLKRRRRAAIDAEREAVVKAAQPSARRVRDAKYLFRSRVVAPVASFDANPDLLNCRNGAIDLRTGTLSPHDPAQRFTYCLDVDYDPQADASRWLDFLRGVVGGGDDAMTYLQQAIGYSLTGHTSEECLFYLYGPTRAGKGTFTETVLQLLSTPLGRQADFSTFTRKRDDDANNFDLATLKPARLVVASESNRHHELNAARIKTLTGGDHVSCAFKYHDNFSYRPQFKIWLVSNFPINADVDDDAAWYRLRVIEFPTSHAGAEDKRLKLRLRQPDNLRGVLRWAVEGARAWYASPAGLVTPPAVTLATTAQREALDYVQTWIDECCVVNAGAWTSNELLYQSYAAWCKENGVTARAQRGLSTALRTKGYSVGTQKKDGGTNRKGVQGLGLTTVTLA